MKRGKDDEKVMGPMFPRLHVNDTEKGGPRAPPRNKMALYEQLSIPSQRFKTGVVSIKSNSTANPASSSQGSGHQMNTLYSHPLPPSRQSPEKPASLYSESTASFLPCEQKNHSEEDDFRVPIFMQSHHGPDRGKPFPSSPVNVDLPRKLISNSNNEPRQIKAIGSNTRQEGRKQNEKLGEVIGAREQSIKAVSNSSSVDKAVVSSTPGDASVSHIPGGYIPSNGSRFLKADQPLLPEYRANSCINSRVSGDAVYNEPTILRSNGNPVPVYDFHHEDDRILDDSESCYDKTCRSSPTEVADRDDDASETSMVDSISGLDITPDDVVGIIGQKHFWKARRAIVNQQRVFAVQVFELHRLIKVQKLIGELPRLLLEDSTYLGKPIKGSSFKKPSVDYAVKGVPNSSKQKNDSEKQNHKMECSAENTVGKSFSSVQNGSQMAGYKTFAASSPAPAAAAAGDHTTNPWCFHQPQGQQWLVPVMSPSEGLVYKPYPGPGFMAPACGSCGPPGSTAMMGNFFPPSSYGVPASHHYQGMGVPPFTATAGPQGYFPPYGMGVMNQGIGGSPVDPMTHLTSSGSHGQPPWMGVKNNVPLQRSSNLPSPKAGPVADVTKSQVSREGELQISTASSPSARVQRNGRGHHFTDGGSALPLFPTSPPVVEAPSLNSTPPPPLEAGYPTARVIKVVPRNGRLATESVARIFRSIQEERKHYDSS